MTSNAAGAFHGHIVEITSAIWQGTDTSLVIEHQVGKGGVPGRCR